MNPFGQFIGSAYTYAQSIIGLCVFIMFIYSGICYLFNEGKDFMTGRAAWWVMIDAAAGAVLLFSAYVILNTINHDLVSQQATEGLPVR